MPVHRSAMSGFATAAAIPGDHGVEPPVSDEPISPPALAEVPEVPAPRAVPVTVPTPPGFPGVLDVPDVPGVPDAPDVPDVPDVPGVPVFPVVPLLPDGGVPFRRSPRLPAFSRWVLSRASVLVPLGPLVDRPMSCGSLDLLPLVEPLVDDCEVPDDC